MDPNSPGGRIPEPPIGFGEAGREADVDAPHAQDEPPQLRATDAGAPRSNENPVSRRTRAAPFGAKLLAALAVIVALAIVAVVVF
jgi:hypothetical protein